MLGQLRIGPRSVGNTVGSNKSRKDMRAVVTLVARYRSPTTFEYANESCSDVSVGGMFINSGSPAPAGTLLKLECDIDQSSEQKIRGVARVVWLRREPSEHGPSGMGVKFVKLEPGSRELIEQIVARLAEAGVEARSVSAAPEHRLAAAGGIAATASLSPEPLASPVRLVPSTPPAASNGELSQGDDAASQKRDLGEVATESWPQPAPTTVDDIQLNAVADATASARSAHEDARANIGATGSSRPPAQPSRISWKIWVAGIVVVLIAIALADRRGGSAKKAEVTPEPPAAAPAEPAAQPEAANAPSPEQPKAAEPPPQQPKAAEPTVPAAAAVVAPPKAMAAADAKPGAATAQPAQNAELVPASATEPLFPRVPGQPDYVVDFVSQPNAATITVDEKATLTTPATINLGGMPDRIKVTAKKPGFKSSSIWMKRDGFELKNGVLKRRAYVTLHEEPATPAAK